MQCLGIHQHWVLVKQWNRNLQIIDPHSYDFRWRISTVFRKSFAMVISNCPIIIYWERLLTTGGVFKTNMSKTIIVRPNWFSCNKPVKRNIVPKLKLILIFSKNIISFFTCNCSRNSNEESPPVSQFIAYLRNMQMIMSNLLWACVLHSQKYPVFRRRQMLRTNLFSRNSSYLQIISLLNTFFNFYTIRCDFYSFSWLKKARSHTGHSAFNYLTYKDCCLYGIILSLGLMFIVTPYHFFFSFIGLVLWFLDQIMVT